MFYDAFNEILTVFVGGSNYTFIRYASIMLSYLVAITVIRLLVNLVSPNDTAIKRTAFKVMYTFPIWYAVFEILNAYAPYVSNMLASFS